MKLKKVCIENFKSIKKIEFEYPESGILVLVGENNSGKSNIIRAIEAISGETWYGKEKLEDRDYYQRNSSNSINVNLYFDNGRSVHFAPTSTDWGTKYYTDWNQTRPVKYNEPGIKDDFPCTYLGADRTLDKHLSFFDWTLIGKIKKAFHKKVSEETKEKLNEKFEELVSLFSEVPGFDNFKKDFANYYDELTPYSKSKLKIQFKPFTPANYFKTIQILAEDPAIGNKIVDLEELGEGSRNLILISLLRSYAKNFKGSNELSGVLALEEPELFLHPQARRHLFFILREIAQTGLQVIVSTHSSSFIDTEYFDEIGRVIKVADEENNCEQTSLITLSKDQLVSYCIETNTPASKVNKENITEFYRTTSNYRLNEGFFARCLILVEGETEELCIPEYLQHKCIKCDALGISVIAVNGKNQIPKYWRLFSAFEIPIIVVLDNDNSDGKEKSNQNLATCFNVSNEDIVSMESSCKVLYSNTDRKTPLLILNKDFETSLKSEIGDEIYRDYEAKAKNIIKPIGNQQKGVIARYICRKLIEENSDFTPSFISELIQLIQDFVPQEQTGIEAVPMETENDFDSLFEDDLPF